MSKRHGVRRKGKMWQRELLKLKLLALFSNRGVDAGVLRAFTLAALALGLCLGKDCWWEDSADRARVK